MEVWLKAKWKKARRRGGKAFVSRGSGA